MAERCCAAVGALDRSRARRSAGEFRDVARVVAALAEGQGSVGCWTENRTAETCCGGTHWSTDPVVEAGMLACFSAIRTKAECCSSGRFLVNPFLDGMDAPQRAWEKRVAAASAPERVAL